MYRKIRQFVEMLVRRHILDEDLEAGYELMAQDEALEAEALEWTEGTLKEIAEAGRGGAADAIR